MSILINRLITDLNIGGLNNITNETNRMAIISTGVTSLAGDNGTIVHFDFDDSVSLNTDDFRRDMNAILAELQTYPQGFGVTSYLANALDAAYEVLANDSLTRPPELSVVAPIIITITDVLFQDAQAELLAATNKINAIPDLPNATISATALEPVLPATLREERLDVLRNLGQNGVIETFISPAGISSTSAQFTRFMDGLARNFIREAVCCEDIPICSEFDTDIVLLLDSSVAIDQANPSTIRSFVQQILEPIDVGPDASRIGLITFDGNGADTQFNLQASLQLDAVDMLEAAIANTGLPSGNQPPSEETDISQAFVNALDLLAANPSSDPTRRNPLVLAVLTNYPSAFNTTEFVIRQERLALITEASINVLAVGPGVQVVPSPSPPGTLHPDDLQRIATQGGLADFALDFELNFDYATSIRNEFICRDVETDAPTSAPSSLEPTNLPTAAPTSAPSPFDFLMHFGNCGANVATATRNSTDASTGGECHDLCLLSAGICVAFEFDTTNVLGACTLFTIDDLTANHRNDLSHWLGNGPGVPQIPACFLRVSH